MGFLIPGLDVRVISGAKYEVNMKKKEKEHLKADPFVHFFEKTLCFF